MRTGQPAATGRQNIRRAKRPAARRRLRCRLAASIGGQAIRRRYTKEELAGEAAILGFESSQRLLAAWIAGGLLGRAERHGLGPRRGTTRGTWSDAQKDLFLTLLARKQGGHSTVSLSNVPVWAWLYAGDSFVSLEQARHALKTWSGVTAERPWPKPRRITQMLLRDWVHPDAPTKARREFLRTVYLMHIESRLADGYTLELMKRLYDPHACGVPLTLGPTPADPKIYLEQLRAAWFGLHAPDFIRDSVFEQARFVKLAQGALDKSMTAGKAAEAIRQHRILDPALDDTCKSLITLVGFGRQNLDPAGLT
jgi:hypothetical protein